MNINGSIDLLKLELAGVATIKGKRCVVIPIEENDIYTKVDEQTLKATSAHLGVSVYQRQQPSQYGKTHYAKQSLSKKYREEHPEATEAKKSVYIGDFTTFEIGQPIAQAPIVAAEHIDEDDLPF